MLEEPAEERSAGTRSQEALLRKEAHLNAGMEARGGREAPQGAPAAVQPLLSPQDPSEEPAEEASKASVPLANAGAEDLNSGGRRLLGGAGRAQRSPLVGGGAGAPSADPVWTPEAAVEAFFRPLSSAALPEPAVDARVLLEDRAVVAVTFAALFGDEKADLLVLEKRSGDEEAL